MPENNRKPPAGTGGNSENEQLAGHLDADSTADLAAVAQSAWEALVGLLLTSPPVESARELLAGIPPGAPDPSIEWWINAARINADALTICNPLTAVSGSVRAGVEPPPAFRGHAVSEGWRLVSKVTSVPFTCAGDFVDIVRADRARRASESAAERIAQSSWRGEVAQLAELWQREATAVFAMLTEAVSING